MKAFLVSALALGALSSVALAEPVELTDAEMDSVTAAGAIGFFSFGDPAPTFRSTFVPPSPGPVTSLSDPISPLLDGSGPVPPLLDGFERFVSPGGTIAVIRDGDGVTPFPTRRGFRIARPTVETFPPPSLVIIITQNVVVPATAP